MLTDEELKEYVALGERYSIVAGRTDIAVDVQDVGEMARELLSSRAKIQELQDELEAKKAELNNLYERYF